jgi:hydroxypyruvate isomerase
MGYTGTVGLEAWATDGDSDRALDRFRHAFTV